MNYEKFIAEYYPDATEKEINNIRLLCDTFENIIKGDISVVQQLDQDSLSPLFFIKDDELARTQYVKIIAFIKAIYEWVAKKTSDASLKMPKILLRDLLLDESSKKHYFVDEKDLMNTVDKIFILNGLNREEREIKIKSILYLAWYGFTTIDMAELEIKSLDYKTKTINFKDEEVKISEDAFDALSQYSTLVYANEFNTDRKYLLKDSKYLFRTKKAEKTNPCNLRLLISNFNSYAENTGKQFVLRYINRNGQFVKVLSAERGGLKVNDAITNVTGANTSNSIVDFKTHYEKWKEVFDI